MKKVGILVLVSIIMIMCFTANVTADSEKNNENEVKAEILKELGLFKGSNQGFELDREPNRLESGVMLIRLLGKEKEALAMKFSHPFTDVPSWADSYIGYMYEKGYTNGIGNNMYGSDNLTQAKSYTTFVLRALGYSDTNGDFSWSESLEKASEIGLINEQTITKLSGKVFLRDDMVGISYDALKVDLKDNKITLIDKLIEEKAVSADISEKKGLITKIQESKITKITFSDFDQTNNNHFIHIDRSTLPNSMQDFYKICVMGLGIFDEDYFQISLVSMERSNREQEKFECTNPYNEIQGECANYYGATSIFLYDKDGKRVGAALFKAIKEGTIEVAFKEYKTKYPDNFEEVLEPFYKLPELNTGIMYAADHRSTYVYVDKALLPKEIESYGGFVVLSGDGCPVEEDFYMFYKNYWYPTPSQYELHRFSEEEEHLTLILFSKDGTINGYKVLEKNPASTSPVKLIQIEFETEYMDDKPSPSDFSVKRYINNQLDTSFNDRAFSYGTEDIIKEIPPKGEDDDCKIIKEGLKVHIGPYLQLDDSVRYEITSDTVEIKNLKIVKLH